MPTPRAITLLLLVGLLTAWLGQSLIGPPRPDGSPDRLLLPLQVQAAHDDERILIRLRWPTPEAHRYHDVLRFDGERWEVLGAGDAPGLGEERVSMMLDDGGVPEFARYGGYLLIGDGTRFMPGAADEADVEAHPILGQELGLSDIRKHLPDSRLGRWDEVPSTTALEAQRAAGYFLDLWHWRGDRGGPVNVVDDLHVAEHRHPDQGRSSYGTNWDDERGQPRYMFDPERAGQRALHAGQFDTDGMAPADTRFLTPDNRLDFDPEHDWQPGDTLPRRFLREADGSRADIEGHGGWENGWREVVFSRALDTGNPLEDKVIRPGGQYSVAFAVHSGGATGRHHHVSLPLSLGLDRPADIPVQRMPGGRPDWSRESREVMLFYPGQVNWPRITGPRHAGAEAVDQGIPASARHDAYQLALYGVEAEAEDAVVRRWLISVGLGLLFIVAVAAAGLSLGRRGP